MSLVIAAIRSGTDPWGPLPPGAFHRTLDDQIVCPKCDAGYNLVVDFDEGSRRHFEENARPLLLMLKKAIFMGHANEHRVSHFETNGVVVRGVGPVPMSATIEPPPRQTGDW